MASNTDKTRARALMEQQPDLKYTEALRHIQQDRQPTSVNPLLAYGVDMTTGKVANFDPFGNIVISGGTGSGGTVALRALMATALRRGWCVDAFHPRVMNWFESLAIHPRGRSHLTSTRKEGWEEQVDSLLLSVAPGTAHRPQLLILDVAEEYLVDPGGKDGHRHRRWIEHLAHLMGAQHTAVALRVQRLSPAVPDQLASLIEVKIEMGHGPAHHRALLYSSLAEAVQSGAVRSIPRHPARVMMDRGSVFGSGTRGVSLMWDGQTFRAVKGTFIDWRDDGSDWSVRSVLSRQDRLPLGWDR